MGYRSVEALLLAAQTADIAADSAPPAPRR
jgi:hypothetical protein